MPDIEAGALAPIEQVHYRQALMPNHMTGSFEGSDANYHDFRVAARGKNVLGIFIDNPTDTNLASELWGLHLPDSLPNAAGAVKIGDIVTLTADQSDDSFADYPFPFYLLRCYFAGAPTDDPPKTVTVWVDLSPWH